MKILRDLRLLKDMAKAGIISLHEDTGQIVKHWSGQKVKAYYISNGPFSFEYKGELFGTRYFDGCFCPFIVKLDPCKKHETTHGRFA
jgi:hypothetical protein